MSNRGRPRNAGGRVLADSALLLRAMVGTTAARRRQRLHEQRVAVQLLLLRVLPDGRLASCARCSRLETEQGVAGVAARLPLGLEAPEQGTQAHLVREHEKGRHAGWLTNSSASNEDIRQRIKNTVDFPCPPTLWQS